MLSKYTAIFCFVFFANQSIGLKELPPVDDNNILSTELVIRKTVNTLFSLLKLGGLNDKPKLKRYSTVHKHLISFTLQDYNNLKEIAKLTRVERNKTSNEIKNFIATIDELLNEDNDVHKKEFPDVDNESVITYVDQFLTTLKGLKEEFGVDTKNNPIKDDIYNFLKDDSVASFNNTMYNVNSAKVADDDTILEENEFWKPDANTRRVYRGSRTKIKHYPFMASIQIFNKFHCGGCIIKSDLVITASSCLQLAWNNRFFRENPAFLSVRVGSSFYSGGGENIPVLEVYFHPQYNPKTLWNNLCVLRLVRRLFMKRKTRRIKKIDFDRHPSTLPLTTDGITIIGWGAKGTSNIVKNAFDNILSYAVLDIYPLQECQEIYSKQYVTKKHFCAGFFSKGGGACNHDVGGPGIVAGTLTGIVSFGSPVCGATDAPTVFTKLGYYAEWIDEILEMESPKIRQRTTLRTTLGPPTAIFLGPETTTFKIPPLVGKLKPIPISEVDALRTLTSSKLFQEFLSTMFTEDQKLEYEDMLGEHLKSKDLDKLNKEVIEMAESAVMAKPPPESKVEVVPDMGPNVVTEISNFEPEDLVRDYDVEDQDATKASESNRGFNNDLNLNYAPVSNPPSYSQQTEKNTIKFEGDEQLDELASLVNNAADLVQDNNKALENIGEVVPNTEDLDNANSNMVRLTSYNKNIKEPANVIENTEMPVDIDINFEEPISVNKQLEKVTNTETKHAGDNKNMGELLSIDKNLQGLVELDKQIGKLLNGDKKQFNDIIHTADDFSKVDDPKQLIKMDESKKLEKDLVNLIDEIDLKEIIETMPSVEEEKLAEDEKVIKLFQEKEAQDKKTKDDDVLTLLYLSSAENSTKKETKVAEPEYLLEEEDDEEYDDGRNGISIEAAGFKDLTYRSENITNILNKLTKEEIAKLLARHLGHLQPNVW